MFWRKDKQGKYSDVDIELLRDHMIRLCTDKMANSKTAAIDLFDVIGLGTIPLCKRAEKWGIDLDAFRIRN